MIEGSIVIAFYNAIFLIIVILIEKKRNLLFVKKLKIKRLKREYENILEKFPEGVLITNAKNQVLFMN
jgi:hypothetical protein